MRGASIAAAVLAGVLTGHAGGEPKKNVIQIPDESGPGRTIAPSHAQRILWGLRPRIVACFDAALADDPRATGTLRYQLRIGPAGEVASVSIQPSGRVPTDLVACAGDALRASAWDPPGGGGVTAFGTLVLVGTSKAVQGSEPDGTSLAVRAAARRRLGAAPLLLAPLVVEGHAPSPAAIAVRRLERATRACADPEKTIATIRATGLATADGRVFGVELDDGGSGLATCVRAHLDERAPEHDARAERFVLRIVVEKGRLRVD